MKTMLSVAVAVALGAPLLTSVHAGIAVAQQRASSFEMGIEFYVGGVYADHLAGESKNVSPQDCRDACVANTACRFWVWRAPLPNPVIDDERVSSCQLLKGGITGRFPNPRTYVGAITASPRAAAQSGRGSTWEPGIDLHAGTSKRGFATESGEQCRDACLRDRMCTGWTWHTSSDSVTPRECYLFIAQVTKQERADPRRSVISGVVNRVTPARTPAPPSSTESLRPDDSVTRLSREDWIKLCTDRSANPDRRIAGCSALLNAGGLSAEQVATAHLNRGNAYSQKRQYGLAVREFDRCIAVVRADFMCWNNRGHNHTLMHQYTRALEDFNQALRINPTHQNSVYNRANVYAKLGQIERAIDEYSRAIGLNPNDARAWYNRGQMYQLSGDAKRAEFDIQAARRLDPRVAPEAE